LTAAGLARTISGQPLGAAACPLRNSLPRLMIPLSEHELWLRYVDWSATQINRRLLELSLDELWARANSQGSESEAVGVPADLLPSRDSPEYLQLVRRATLSIGHELALPAFVEWRDAYLASPSDYDRDLTGIR
jgi:hypothetical protein